MSGLHSHLDGCQDLCEYSPAVSLDDVDHGELTRSHLLGEAVHGCQHLHSNSGHTGIETNFHNVGDCGYVYK